MQPLATPPPLPVRRTPPTQPLEFRSLQPTRKASQLASRFTPEMKVSIGVSVLTLIFLIISIMTSWWGYQASYSGAFQSTTTAQSVDYYLGQGCVSLTTYGGGWGRQSLVDLCVPYTTASTYLPSAKSLENVFSLTSILIMVGLVLSVLTIVFLLIGALMPRVGIIAVLCASVGSVLVLASPIYLYATLPKAIESAQGGINMPLLPISGFFGSSTLDIPGYRGQVEWGAGLGWFMGFVAFLLFFVATVTAVRAVKSIIPLGNMTFGPSTSDSDYQPLQVGYEPRWPSSLVSSTHYSAQDAQLAGQPVQTPQSPIVSSCTAKDAGPPSGPSRAPSAPALSRICPSCHALVEADQPSCKSCGSQIPQIPSQVPEEFEG